MYLGIQLLWLLRSTRRLEGLIGLFLVFFVLGLFMELVVFYLFSLNNKVELVDFDSLGDWLMYEIDDVGVMLEGGVGVAAIYSCAT